MIKKERWIFPNSINIKHHRKIKGYSYENRSSIR